MVIDDYFADYQVLEAAIICANRARSCDACSLQVLGIDKCQKEAMRRLCEIVEDRMEQISELQEENRKLREEIAGLKK